MNTIQELENAVNRLPEEDYRLFRIWFLTQECEVLKHLTFKYSKNKYLRCFM